MHHVLDRPRDAADRTGLGMAGVVFYGVLWAAAGNDIIAERLEALEPAADAKEPHGIAGPR
ncbi:hypothetical protein GCM10010191_23390 [Actinomadura vinacea]|uniref:Uncharacterized protein n=1 Tax=Actinomadura vinacea TaxID=115336 RepID=A0ABN3ISP6_9ACTN